jgi:hypothetical protein
VAPREPVQDVAGEELLVPRDADHSASLLTVVGLFDDRFNIAPGVRLTTQFVAVLPMFFGAGVRVTSFGDLLGSGSQAVPRDRSGPGTSVHHAPRPADGPRSGEWRHPVRAITQAKRGVPECDTAGDSPPGNPDPAKSSREGPYEPESYAQGPIVLARAAGSGSRADLTQKR